MSVSTLSDTIPPSSCSLIQASPFSAFMTGCGSIVCFTPLTLLSSRRILSGSGSMSNFILWRVAASFRSISNSGVCIGCRKKTTCVSPRLVMLSAQLIR